MTRNQGSGISRRQMLTGMAGVAGAAALGPVFKMSEAVASEALNTNSAPSGLKITDMRACTVAANYDYPIIRIDTNQGVYGLGEVRDAGSKGIAMVLRKDLLGKNPLDIEAILASIRAKAADGRNGGGYSAVDMALHDIAGKVHNVPAWKLIGEKKRDRIRIYADTPESMDPKVFASRIKRRKDMGITFFKMDLRVPTLLRDKPGTLNPNRTANEAGLKIICNYIATVREIIGDAPLAADHFGSLTVDDAIRYARAFEPYKLAWAEDLVGWMNWQGLKKIREATSTPVLTGEDIFGLDHFKPLIDNEAVDIIHPDPLTSGALLETKKIADYADRKGIKAAIHFAGSPVGCMASVHMAATLTNLVAMENHALDMPWWSDLVKGAPRPIVQQGYITVPDKPGLGIELNDEVIKEHLRYPQYFEHEALDAPQEIRGYHVGGPWPHYNGEGVLVNNTEE